MRDCRFRIGVEWYQGVSHGIGKGYTEANGFESIVDMFIVEDSMGGVHKVDVCDIQLKGFDYRRKVSFNGRIYQAAGLGKNIWMLLMRDSDGYIHEEHLKYTQEVSPFEGRNKAYPGMNPLLPEEE